MPTQAIKTASDLAILLTLILSLALKADYDNAQEVFSATALGVMVMIANIILPLSVILWCVTGPPHASHARSNTGSVTGRTRWALLSEPAPPRRFKQSLGTGEEETATEKKQTEKMFLLLDADRSGSTLHQPHVTPCNRVCQSPSCD